MKSCLKTNDKDTPKSEAAANGSGAGHGRHKSEQGTVASWVVNQAALIGKYNVRTSASRDTK